VPYEVVLGLVTDAFTGATERHIEVGDGLEIFTIKKGHGVSITYLRESRLWLVRGCCADGCVLDVALKRD
jgi:20S proteasome alpha/beta subunit